MDFNDLLSMFQGAKPEETEADKLKNLGKIQDTT